jgi:hypothetical protein
VIEAVCVFPLVFAAAVSPMLPFPTPLALVRLGQLLPPVAVQAHSAVAIT